MPRCPACGYEWTGQKGKRAKKGSWARRINDALKRSGKTVKQAAKEMGISYSTLYKWSRGYYEPSRYHEADLERWIETA